MALAESSVEDIEKQSLKCRKCRFLVIEDPPHKILNVSTTGLLTDDDSSNTFNICDENLPYWISAAIEEVNFRPGPVLMKSMNAMSLFVQASWTKGKLSCPGCGCRLGGFDYVTRAEQPVYIVKSKVDLKLSGVLAPALTLAKIVQPKLSERGDSEDWVSSESSDVGSQSQSPGLCQS